MKYECSGTYSTNGRLFGVRVTVEGEEVIYDEHRIPASSTDILPEHRGEIIAVMQGLAKQIRDEGEQK